MAKLDRQSVLALLARAFQSGQLPEDGPTSLFLRPEPGALLQRPTQLVVRASGQAFTVRTSRLPFVRPMVFTLDEVKRAQADT